MSGAIDDPKPWVDLAAAGRVLTEKEENNSIAIASNESF